MKIQVRNSKVKRVLVCLICITILITYSTVGCSKIYDVLYVNFTTEQLWVRVGDDDIQLSVQPMSWKIERKAHPGKSGDITYEFINKNGHIVYKTVIGELEVQHIYDDQLLIIEITEQSRVQ